MTYTTFLFCHSRENGNPDPIGSPIRSASLSVEDDGRGWIPHQVRDDKKECGSPIRNASLSVEDDTGVCHSLASGNPVVLSGSRIKCGMTGGDGSPIRSALSRIENKHFLTGMARKWNDILRKS